MHMCRNTVIHILPSCGDHAAVAVLLRRLMHHAACITTFSSKISLKIAFCTCAPSISMSCCTISNAFLRTALRHLKPGTCMLLPPNTRTLVLHLLTQGSLACCHANVCCLPLHWKLTPRPVFPYPSITCLQPCKCMLLTLKLESHLYVS